MSTITPVPKVPSVRTYATDLTAQRAIRGIVSTVQKTVPPTAIPKKPAVPVIQKVAIPAPVLPTPVTAKKKDSAVIPPFHTFQKPVTTPQTSTPNTTIDTSELTKKQALVKPSILAVPTKEILSVNRNVQPEDTGTIITDTKHNRFSLTKEIIQALINRFRTYQKNVALSKQPKYTLPETERRKGVIQKAAVRTGRTSTADHAAVLDRIKNTKRPLLEPTYHTLPAQINLENPTVVTVKNPPIVIEHITEVSTPTIQNSTPPVTGETEISTQDQNDELTAILITPPAKSIPIQLLSIPVSEKIPEIPPVIAAIELAPVIIDDTTPATIPAANPLVRPQIVPTLPVYEITTLQPAGVAAPSNEAPAQRVADTANVEITRTDISAPTAELPKNVEEHVVLIHEPMARPRIVPIVPNLAVHEDTDETVLPYEFAEIGETPVSKPVANWAVPKTETAQTKWRRWLRPIHTEESTWRRLLRSTNQVAIIGVSTVFIGMIVLFGMRVLFAKVATTLIAEQTTPIENQTAFIDTVLHNSVTGPLSKQIIIDTLIEKSSGTDSLVEVWFTNPETKERIQAAALLDLFNTNVSTDFKATLSTISVGGYRGEPWILLTTTNSETGRGGMLQWEKTLGIDLSPWFGVAIKSSGTTKGSAFTDSVISTYDVRILSDNQKTERITYGFIQPNKILITSNTTAFLNLAEKKQK